MSDEREIRRIAEEERGGNAEDLREIERRYHAYPEAQRLRDQAAEAEFLQRQDRESLQDQVRAALDRRSDEEAEADFIARHPEEARLIAEEREEGMVRSLSPEDLAIIEDALPHFASSVIRKEVAMSDERLEDQVRAALDRRSDERYRMDIEPRDGGYALVRNLEPGPFVSEIGNPVMAWKPTLGELQQQILSDDAAHFTLKERTMDPLGTTDPLGRIETKRPDDDLRIPAWPAPNPSKAWEKLSDHVERIESDRNMLSALRDEGIMSRAYGWLREHAPQLTRTLKEDQVLALRIPPQTLKPE